MIKTVLNLYSQIKRILLITVFFVFATATAHGQEYESPSYEIPFYNTLLDRDAVTGNWYGLRNQLKDDGITISSYYCTDIGGNPIGGLKKRTIYTGFLDVGVAFDFEKIASCDGLALTVSNHLISGNYLSSAVGNFFSVQEIYASGNYFLGELDLSLSLLEETLTLEAGRLFAGSTFATCELFLYYVNAGINNYPLAMYFNTLFPSFNIAAWAARTTYEPNANWSFVAAMYNADPRVRKLDNHGAYFSFVMNDGYLAITQLSYEHGQERDDGGLPGSTTFGGYYQSSEFQDLGNPTKRWDGNYGFYLLFDQMIWEGEWPQYKGPHHMRAGTRKAERVKQPYVLHTVAAADRPEGLTVWALAYLAPPEHINIMTYQFSGGLLFQGLPYQRDYDVTALGVILGKFSNKLEDQNMEIVLELNHRFQISEWLYFTPDVQFVINPNGRDDINNALVLGIEASVNF